MPLQYRSTEFVSEIYDHMIEYMFEKTTAESAYNTFDEFWTATECMKTENLFKDIQMRCMMQKNILTLWLFGSKGIRQSILKF